MTQTLAGYEEDIEMSNALRIFGNEDFNLIYPDRNPKDIPIVQGPFLKAKESFDNLNISEISDVYIQSIDRPRSPDGVGSNNWAVAGNKTVTGKPMLANDPHLALAYLPYGTK